ncbi:MAG: COQ9 family protein [Alphaproteobacteria bacterium]
MSADDLYTEEKRAILEAALIEADFDGFSLETLRRGADKAGISRDMQRLAFPRGVMDLVAYYSKSADSAMLEALKAHDLSALKVREKIALAVRLRIDALAAHKPAARRAVQFLTLPQFAPEGMRNLYRAVDTIWRAIGDASTDFNFYTKRALLAGVFTTTLMRWFEDQSEDSRATWEFLDARIENVMQIEKAKAQARKVFERMPSPLSVLNKVRERARSN